MTRLELDMKHLADYLRENDAEDCPVTLSNGIPIRRLYDHLATLTKELEAAHQETAKAREEGLEEAAMLLDKRASVLRSVPYVDEAIPMTPKDMAQEAEESAALVRALKSPDTGTQGTEKGRG